MEGHAPGVLHRAGVELGDEELVVLAERVPHAEVRVVPVEALPGDLEQLVGVHVRRHASCAHHRPRSMPSWWSRTTWYGPATSAVMYGLIRSRGRELDDLAGAQLLLVDLCAVGRRPASDRAP